MSKIPAAVVILNYNGKHFLEKFLPGIVKYSVPYQVFVADNGSTDDSVVFVEQRFPAVRIIQNKGNFGYAKGYNLALKEVDADYYILLNSDVEVTEKWIDPVLSLMEKDHSIAACQPKLLDFSNRRNFEYAGASGGYIDKFGYPFCRGRIFNSLEIDLDQYNNATEVFWATGACLFIKSKPFWLIGGFDEDYFAHMEEIDLCWRLKNTGYKIFVEPASVIYHIGGGTLNKLSSQKTFLNFRNNLSTLTKNHHPKYLFLKIIYRMVLDGIAAFKFLLDGQPKHFWAVLRAHFVFYTWLPALIKKRKILKNIPGFKFNHACMYRRNIVAEYFIRKKIKFTELQGGFLSE